MIIPINEDYRIVSNQYDWAIQFARKRTKNGVLHREWESRKYYPTLEMAAEQLFHLMVRTSDAEGLEEAVAEFRRVGEVIASAIAEAKLCNCSRFESASANDDDYCETAA